MAKATPPQSTGPSAWAVGLVVAASLFAVTSLVLCIGGVG